MPVFRLFRHQAPPWRCGAGFNSEMLVRARCPLFFSREKRAGGLQKFYAVPLAALTGFFAADVDFFLPSFYVEISIAGSNPTSTTNAPLVARSADPQSKENSSRGSRTLQPDPPGHCRGRNSGISERRAPARGLPSRSPPGAGRRAPSRH